MPWFRNYVTNDQLKTAMDTIHDALRSHDKRVDVMDSDNKQALRDIRATQIKVGLGVIGILITTIGGLIMMAWEIVRPALHLGGTP